MLSCLDNTNKVVIPTDMLLDLMKLYKFSGKDAYYNSVFSKDLKAYRSVNVAEEVYYFSKLMELNIKDERLQLLSKKDILPKNNSEKIVLNLKKVFELILFHLNQFELYPNEITALVELMFNDVAKIKFRVERTKEKSSLTNKKEVSNVKDYHVVIKELCEKFERLRKSKEYEITLLITNMFIDFYNTKPYLDTTEYKANECISYLILYILLFKYEFDAFNYKPFFKEIYENMKTFHFVINQSSFNWAGGYADVTSLHKFIIERLLDCYDKVEVEKQKVTHVQNTRTSKTNDIENTILNFPNATFTKAEIQAIHPNASPKTIERTLDRLQEEGKIESLGTGRSARWMKKFSYQAGFDYQAFEFNFEEDILGKK